jgi:hypothetical protein
LSWLLLFRLRLLLPGFLLFRLPPLRRINGIGIRFKGAAFQAKALIRRGRRSKGGSFPFFLDQDFPAQEGSSFQLKGKITTE